MKLPDYAQGFRLKPLWNLRHFNPKSPEALAEEHLKALALFDGYFGGPARFKPPSSFPPSKK